MSKPMPVIDELEQLQSRLRELQHQQLGELRAKRRDLAEALASVDRQISEITGEPVAPSSNGAATPEAGPRKRAQKMPKLVVDSEEYKEITRSVQTILARQPTGMNGKQVADALGYERMNERNRIKELLNDPRSFRKTGQGVSTRFYLR